MLREKSIRSTIVYDQRERLWTDRAASLTDFQVRDLNDEINRLQREKHVWELQLRNIGGTNYMRFGGNLVDENGRLIASHRGYKYIPNIETGTLTRQILWQSKRVTWHQGII